MTSDGESPGEERLYSRKESCSYCSSKVGFQTQMHFLKGKDMTLKWQVPVSGPFSPTELVSYNTGHMPQEFLPLGLFLTRMY